MGQYRYFFKVSTGTFFGGTIDDIYVYIYRLPYQKVPELVFQFRNWLFSKSVPELYLSNRNEF